MNCLASFHWPRCVFDGDRQRSGLVGCRQRSAGTGARVSAGPGARSCARPPGAPQTLRALMDEVEHTRQRGYAMVFDAYEAGTSAMAAPVRVGRTDEPIGTVSIARPSIRMTKGRMETLAPQLQACASALALT